MKVVRFYLIALALAPLLGVDLAILICLGRATANSDIPLLLASVFCAVPVAGLQYLLVRRVMAWAHR